MSSESAPQAFRPVPRTGVIFVTTEAQKRGFHPADPDWCNLGQGQPETGELPGAPPRVQAVAVDPADQEYAPVAGLWELREAIAAHYNRIYRRGLPSQYSAENVSVSGGGRASLTRAAEASIPATTRCADTAGSSSVRKRPERRSGIHTTSLVTSSPMLR